MIFEEDNIEHNIIYSMNNRIFYGYDILIELPDNDKFIKNNLKIIYKKDKQDKDTKEIDYEYFNIKEEKTWWNFPKFEVVGGEIIPFDWEKYQYFQNTNRRMILASKINRMYNKSSEKKILRKTIKYLMDELNIPYPDFFKKYNDKIEAVIENNKKRIDKNA